MLIPPLGATGIGAEPSTSTFALIYGISAFRTAVDFLFAVGVFLPAAVRLHRILRNTDCFWNHYITAPVKAHFINQALLVISHACTSVPREAYCRPHLVLDRQSSKSVVNKQKNNAHRRKNLWWALTVSQELDLWFIVFCAEMMYFSYGYSLYLMKASLNPAALTLASMVSAFALTE